MHRSLFATVLPAVRCRRLALLLHTTLDAKLTVIQTDHHATGRFLLRCPRPNRCRIFNLINQHLNRGFILKGFRCLHRGVQFIKTLQFLSAEFPLRRRQHQIMLAVIAVVSDGSLTSQ